jgi:hypothetical protein
VTKARCADAAASFFVLATFVLGSFTVGTTPAMAADYGCRGDQACVKIAETTKCDAACQQACKEYRFDYVTCYTVWGPKFEFMREQQRKGVK